MTSRQPVIDIIELISNLIASASHLQELIEIEDDLDKKDELWLELYELIDIRRLIMKEIECKDKRYWCSLKHAIAQWGFAIEILYAERNQFRKEIVEAMTKYMYKTISRYIGVPVVDCSRCLIDSLDIKKQDERDTEL